MVEEISATELKARMDAGEKIPGSQSPGLAAGGTAIVSARDGSIVRSASFSSSMDIPKYITQHSIHRTSLTRPGV